MPPVKNTKPQVLSTLQNLAGNSSASPGVVVPQQQAQTPSWSFQVPSYLSQAPGTQTSPTPSSTPNPPRVVRYNPDNDSRLEKINDRYYLRSNLKMAREMAQVTGKPLQLPNSYNLNKDPGLFSAGDNNYYALDYGKQGEPHYLAQNVNDNSLPQFYQEQNLRAQGKQTKEQYYASK